MKRLFSLAAALGTVLFATAQLTEITIEPVSEIEAPDGYTTYRIYANMTNELDFISAVFGDSEFPLFLECTGDIYQTDLGGDLATAINPAFFGSFPELEYDSWFTIGGENAPEFPTGLAPQTTFSSDSETLVNFNNGEGFLVADPIGGSWFNTYPCTDLSGTELEDCADGNLAFAGADLKVLLGQITATGDVYGLFNCQVFVDGEQANTVFTGFNFSTTGEVFGCTNPEATNYDESLGATIDDLSCVFPCTLELVAGSETVTSPFCFGGNTGTIQIEAIGAQGADYYFKDEIAGTASNFGNFGGLLAGSYDIIVTDAAGCGDTLEVTVPDAEPLSIVAELTSTVSCNGGSDAVITITSTTGGAGNYLYAFSQNPTELTTETVYSGLSADYTYTFSVFDGNGCLAQSTPIQPTDPQPLGVGLSYVVDATCASDENGEIAVVAFGGGFVGQTPPATTFSVDGENFGPSPIAVSGGIYTVTVQNTNGCTATLEEQVEVGPPAIEVNAVAEPELCFGAEDGEVSWAPQEGSGEYMYMLNGESVTTEFVGMLAPGEYTVTVTDSEGCSESETVIVDAATEIAVSTDVVDASCFGDEDGVVTIEASGGSGSFQYSEDGTNYINTNEFGGFGAGSYTVFVQDELGCVETGTASVDEPDEIVISGIVSEGSMDGEGTIDVTVTGGSLPYEYEWIGPGVNGQSTQDLEKLSTGAYIVEVTDANGCSSIVTFNITTSDIQELERGVVATVYPNPSHGVFVVDVLGGFQGDLDYVVVDAQGRTVVSGQWVATGSFFRADLDLTNAEAGMYRLVMVANGRPTSLQLVKTN